MRGGHRAGAAVRRGRGQRRQPQRHQEATVRQAPAGHLPAAGGRHRGGAGRAQEDTPAQAQGKASQDRQRGQYSADGNYHIFPLIFQNKSATFFLKKPDRRSCCDVQAPPLPSHQHDWQHLRVLPRRA